ncbi:MAG: hypothetical protein IPP31_13535 [Chitinophagaceae bacterium]|nr:hypothetical protein [Chitinophagaceae bacterium]
MVKSPTCFVIIGYGKKTSYANGKLRVLDLDETFTLLIKPVFDALNIPCYRAIDKNLNGSIDKLMLQEIKDAYIAIADISTLNANVMWELGVRHALKPRHTIMICEKEQMASMPFDINHFVVHQYAHSEEGIPHKEVSRFQQLLTRIVQELMADDSDRTDSPVFTFLDKDPLPATAKINLVDDSVAKPDGDSFASVMAGAEEAKKNKDFGKALELLAKARDFAAQNMTLKENLPFIICRQALCTYKSKNPNELEALLKGKLILDELKPEQSQDIEVLGLSGAICKRLNELTSDEQYLSDAIGFYEKGFQLKQDYYNGINAAFMTYKRAASLKKQGLEWEDEKLKADFIRNSVLKICQVLESAPGFTESADAVWVLFTLADAYRYKDRDDKMREYEEKAMELAREQKDDFAMTSYHDQLNKVIPILAELNKP